MVRDGSAGVGRMCRTPRMGFAGRETGSRIGQGLHMRESRARDIREERSKTSNVIERRIIVLTY